RKSAAGWLKPIRRDPTDANPRPLSRSVAPEPAQPFELLETLRWTPQEGFFLLDRHLERLEASAAYFGFQCSIEQGRDALTRKVAGTDQASRIRLLVGRGGEIRTECLLLELSSGVCLVRLATLPIDPADPFLFHKTTHRWQQDRERRSPSDEIILW